MNTKVKLVEIDLKGYKSINNDGQKITINNDITVFIGANGVGKSNIVSFFQMLSYAMCGSLQNYLGENGFAESFLYYGSKQIPRIAAKIKFQGIECNDEYWFCLAHAAGDTLIFTEETISWKKNSEKKPFVLTLPPGLKESQLFTELKGSHKATISVVLNIIKGCKAYQFHDTTREAKIRKNNYINDNRFFGENANNLAAYLYGIKTQKDGEPYYKRIINYIKQVMPKFDDFIMEPSIRNENYINLDWRENGNNHVFGAHQLSDGTLRFIALATLLLQPPKMMPSVIVIDEPELGLHPSAISILAGMVKTASQHAQIILATQSPRLVDEFHPNNITVIERDSINKTSVFQKLNEEDLEDWLKLYSTSELWEKNVIGGKP